MSDIVLNIDKLIGTINIYGNITDADKLCIEQEVKQSVLKGLEMVKHISVVDEKPKPITVLPITHMTQRMR